MYFTVEKIERLLSEIRASIVRGERPIPEFKFREAKDIDPARGEPYQVDYDDSDWSLFPIGGTWGGYDVTAWFRVVVPIPPEWAASRLALQFMVGPRDGGLSTAETMLYVEGQPVQGIDIWHEEAWLPPELAHKSELRVALKAWSGVIGVPDRRRFKLARLVMIDTATDQLYHRAWTLLESIKLLSEDDLRRIRMVSLLNDTFNRLDLLKPRSEAFYASVASANQFLEAGIQMLGAVEAVAPRVTSLGHAHIDVAWQWRLKDTREKVARTFSTVLHLMRQFPEYRFVHSTPQVYKFLKEDYPDIYARVKEKILAGRWEITGGMWVESDTNVPSGESLVRQLMHGKRFQQEEFAQEPKVVWLPDVFGFSAALPQIMAKCGMKYFFTTKVSWSQFNRFPYDTFKWRGIDGTEVLAYFTTTPEEGSLFYTYNGTLSPQQVKGVWDAYQQKDLNDELLILFGWGDGGGGPTREMLETGRVLANVPGIPQVEMGRAEPFFERLEKRLEGQRVPVWDGELYLEYHRGTYTSQAHIKRSNRQAEVLYHEIEWLCSLASLLDPGFAYPQEELRQGWELILLNQFHDILPGSSIRQVYEDSRKQYETIRAVGETAWAKARAVIAARLDNDSGPSLLVTNALGWNRGGLLTLPLTPELEGQALLGVDGQVLPAQVVAGGQPQPGLPDSAASASERVLLAAVPEAPALGYRVYRLEALPTSQDAEEQSSGRMQISPERMENQYYHIELNARGQISYLYDKINQRSVLAPGQVGNALLSFEDIPLKFDAWDIDIYYQDKMTEVTELLECAVEEYGPVRASLCMKWRLRESTITQWLSIYSHSPRIDFRTAVDWHEHRTLLKAAFALDVRSTRAAYDIQFGNIERPTHWNTSWDYARFEVLAHKWADLSEGNYGVALLNDCKYGYDVKDNVMRLTLIKSGIDPDETADQGRHVFTYSLLPHAGGWRDGGVIPEAYALNNPLRAYSVPARSRGAADEVRDYFPETFTLAHADSDTIIIETVKRAEDSDALVLRVYETKQNRCQTSIHFARPIAKAVECNLLEQDEQPVSYEGQKLSFLITPYEIKTFKVWF